MHGKIPPFIKLSTKENLSKGGLDGTSRSLNYTKYSFCIIQRIEKRFGVRRVRLPLLAPPLALSFAPRR